MGTASRSTPSSGLPLGIVVAQNHATPWNPNTHMEAIGSSEARPQLTCSTSWT